MPIHNHVLQVVEDDGRRDRDPRHTHRFHPGVGHGLGLVDAPLLRRVLLAQQELNAVVRPHQELDAAAFEEVDHGLHARVDPALHVVHEAVVLHWLHHLPVEELPAVGPEELGGVADGLLELHPLQLQRLLLIELLAVLGLLLGGEADAVPQAPVVVLDEQEEVARTVVKLLALLRRSFGRLHERVGQRECPQRPQEGLVQPGKGHLGGPPS
mmetsp:Transcript_37695/g.99717  ORF Transcript_37695/g.99717 Transcript_37695/m.99717 type:complete len:212 (-) Transcript_37695:271-906(-)